MNYAAHYDRLIARARERTLTGYKERHHVLPKCMGGTDEKSNLVDLTAEEHKAQISARHAGAKRPPETGARISAALKKAWARRKAVAA